MKIIEILFVLFLIHIIILPLMLITPSAQNAFLNNDYTKTRESWSFASSSTLNIITTFPYFNETVKLPLFKSINAPWTMQSHDMYHTGRSAYNTSNNSGIELWQIRGVTAGEVWSSAVIDEDNMIYFGTLGSDHSLYALFPNGTIKWRFQADGMIWSTPAISSNRTIYVPTWESNLIALDSDGHVLWRFPAQGPISSSVTIGDDGTLYFGTMTGNLFAVSPNGTEKWRLFLDGNLISSPAIGLNQLIYVGTTNDRFYALNPNGTIRWTYTAGEFKANPSIADDGTIYEPCFDGFLYAFNPNGTVKWRASTGDSIAAAGVALAEDGTIYCGTEKLRAFYPNGTLMWAIDLNGSIYSCVPAVSKDGTIYVSAGVSLVAINANGTEKWRHLIATQNAYSSPSIGQDGTVYVGSRSNDYGFLHAFGTGEPKKIEISQPKPGRLYLFDHDLGQTYLNRTIIIGSVTIKVNVYCQHELQNISFSIGSNTNYIEKPPYEWKMNKRYGDSLLTKLTINVNGYYRGGASWSESIPVWYLHFRKNP